MSEKNYIALEEISLVYPVGRDNIPDQTFSVKAGDLVKGSPDDNRLRIRAIHFANDKYYNTPIFLPLEKFALEPEKTEIKSPVNLTLNNVERTLFATAFLSITLALILNNE